MLYGIFAEDGRWGLTRSWRRAMVAQRLHGVASPVEVRILHNVPGGFNGRAIKDRDTVYKLSHPLPGATDPATA